MDREPPTEPGAKCGIVAYLISDDPATRGWLEDLGLIVIGQDDDWSLTPTGEATMARLYERCDQELLEPLLH